jgi:hypothetical protein
MTKPTGRPLGRPKTNWYVTLMARVPEELADRVKRYAGLHHQSISVVIRDGLEMLLEDERYRPFLSDRNVDDDIVSDTNADLPEAAERQPEIVSDTKWDPAEIVSDRNAAQGDILSDTNEDVHQGAGLLPGIVSDTNGAHGEPAPDPEAPAIVSDIITDFDSTKYTLGELCVHGHDYHGSGQSLRRRADRECLACQAARQRAAKARKRQRATVG